MLLQIPLNNIKDSYRVLEIGPGANPNPRSDVLLELKYDDEKEAFAQSGYKKPIKSDKTVFYDGTYFPFRNNEFDYVICSHVIEHVENVELFIEEMNRVANHGYIEYPTIYYDYLFNIKEHLNLIKRTSNDTFQLSYLKKSDSGLMEFNKIQSAFNFSLFQGYGNTIIPLYKNILVEGFEWEGKLKLKEVKSIEDLIYKEDLLKGLLPKKSNDNEYIGIKNSLQLISKELKHFISKKLKI